MKIARLLSTAALITGLCAGAGQAASLLGQNVTGTLRFASLTNNFFDPSQGFVPAGFLNTAGPTVTIADPDVEFGFDDGFSFITADFTGGMLDIADVVSSGSNLATFTMTFVSDAFFGATLNETSDTFEGGLDGSLLGDTLTFSFGGGVVSGPMAASYSIELAAIPVPATMPLLLGAVLGGGLVLRRKARKS